MSTILHIDASIRAANNPNPNHNSISKNIAHHFIQSWKKQFAIDEYIYRDVGMNPPPFITQEWMGAAFTPEQKRNAEQQQILCNCTASKRFGISLRLGAVQELPV